MEKGLLISDSEYQRRQWHRFAQLGIALVILGIIALAATLDSSVPVMVFGWILGLSGVLEIIHAFQVHRSVGFFLHMIPGITSVPVGLLVATRSDFGPLAWTLLFACLFTVVGPYRTITAYSLRFPNWRWAVFDGLGTLLFAIALWAAWPWWAVWFFGLTAGCSLILRGWSTIMLAVGLRNRRTTGRTHLRAA
jgi:uncharacterized membrane protein HdeD (DUF308 family)